MKSMGWCLGVLVCSVAANAKAQGITEFDSAWQDGTGIYISQLDNPVVRGQVPVTYPESAYRPRGNADWHYYRFELEMHHHCTNPGVNPYCNELDTRGDEIANNLWPRVEVVVEPSGTQQVDVEAASLAIDYLPSTVEIIKDDHLQQSSLIGSAQVRLSEETLLVPINVAIVVPPQKVEPDWFGKMDGLANSVVWAHLFDDVWWSERNRSMSPDGGLDYAEAAWYEGLGAERYGATSIGLTSLGESMYAASPDHIFAQCGIQFRLASVVHTNLTFTEDEDPNNDKRFFDWMGQCGDSTANIGTMGALNARLVQEGNFETDFGAFAPGYPTLFIAPHADGPNCSNPLAGLSLSDGHFGVISVADYTLVDKAALNISHELTHILGASHLGDARCQTHPSLLCGSPAHQDTHIPGCNQWGWEPAELPADAKPYGCTEVPDEPAGGETCSLIRGYVRTLLGLPTVPVPMEPAAEGGVTWTSGSGTLSFNTELFTEGSASLSVGGSGYRVITSPAFGTADWVEIGTALAVDVLLQDSQPNPDWKGSLDGFATIAAAGIDNTYLGHVELTPIAQNTWTTVEFSVPEAFRQALLGDHPDAKIEIAVNTAEGAPAVLLDNLRFTGELTAHEPHDGPSSGGATCSVFSFDQLDDWTASSGSVWAAEDWTEGDGALAFTGSGYGTLTSRSFSTDELPPVTSVLSIDLMPPANPPNPYWLGALQAFLTCPEASVSNAYLGQVELSGTFAEEFNTLEFGLSADIVGALSTPGVDCALTLALNVSESSGTYAVDNLAFR